MTVRCYIALGSNLDKPLDQVNRAVTALRQLAVCRVLEVSPWYQTKAIGPGQQPDFINGVVCMDTEWSAIDLLHALQKIELDQQRVRLERWGPRTLDLDILLYGNQTIHSPTLTVPHPRMYERSFVLAPLADIAPQLCMPDGSSLHTRLHDLRSDDIERLEVS